MEFEAHDTKNDSLFSHGLSKYLFFGKKEIQKTINKYLALNIVQQGQWYVHYESII